MARPVIILTGAPESHTLDWGAQGLLGQFDAPVASFARLPAGRHAPEPRPTPASTAGHAVWRSLPPARAHAPAGGFSQQHDVQAAEQHPASADFLTTASFSLDASFRSDPGSQVPDHLASHFYERSLAAHDDVPSSQLSQLAPSSARSLEASLTTASNDFSLRSLDDASDVAVRPPLAERGADRLSDLADIPNAAHLTRIEPQVVTVTLIVGVISVAAPRAVRTRWGAARTLVEVLVGDDTKSGFSVTFWLGPGGDAGAGALAGLRTQDVVLLQNVALSVFTGRVYGQSLRKGMTRVHVLYRRRLDEGDAGGYYSASDVLAGRPAHPQLEKTRRVREWVLRFVGGGDEGPRRRGREVSARTPWDMPPLDDTQL